MHFPRSLTFILTMKGVLFAFSGGVVLQFTMSSSLASAYSQTTTTATAVSDQGPFCTWMMVSQPAEVHTSCACPTLTHISTRGWSFSEVQLLLHRTACATATTNDRCERDWTVVCLFHCQICVWTPQIRCVPRMVPKDPDTQCCQDDTQLQSSEVCSMRCTGKLHDKQSQDPRTSLPCPSLCLQTASSIEKSLWERTDRRSLPRQCSLAEYRIHYAKLLQSTCFHCRWMLQPGRSDSIGHSGTICHCWYDHESTQSVSCHSAASDTLYTLPKVLVSYETCISHCMLFDILRVTVDVAQQSFVHLTTLIAVL